MLKNKNYANLNKIKNIGGDIMVVNKDVCVGCGTCVDICPVSAISMVDGKAQINKDICISCGACMGACPVNAITE